MTFPQVMSGHERTYRPPRALREHVGAEVTAWDLFRLEHDEQAGAWAHSTLTSVVAAIEAEDSGILGCTECLDTGFYGATSPDNPDLLLHLVRRVGDGDQEALAADGSWQPWTEPGPLEVLDTATAADLADAVTSDAVGLLRLYGAPRAFLPPADCTSTQPLGALISAAQSDTPQHDSAQVYALVHDVDQGAVLDVWKITAGGGIERWDEKWYVTDGALRDQPDLLLVPLNQTQLDDVQRQMTSTEAVVADAPLTVSPDPRAERLRRYWSTGKGALKIRWLTPGDWKRCYRHLAKYMGVRAKGYCQNLHKRNTAVWTGSRFNVGGNGHHHGHFGVHAAGAPIAPEAALLAALRSGRVTGDTEGKNTMPDQLADGVYTEVDDLTDPLLQALAAGGVPLAAPDAWFEDPKLDKVTTVTVTDEGRVYGHLAPWGVSHIGMAGSVPVPHNRTGTYAYFRTGQHVTASGKSVRVGQLTLSGGHASTTDPAMNVASVVKHYDDTNSAVADVAAGEDSHGIWVAGALRPGVTPEQVRVMRASPPSGDWRRINGELELVAACHVNVQGFPIAAAAYLAGSVEALVAAGARHMADLRLAERADAAVVQRLGELEGLVASLVAAGKKINDPEDKKDKGADEAVEEAADAKEDAADKGADEASEGEGDELSPAEAARAARIAKARGQVAADKRAALRKRVTAAGPPGKTTIAGTDSFPIGNVADLKNAIQAFGRAGDKPAAKKHIISMAYKLKRPDLIPDNWRGAGN